MAEPKQTPERSISNQEFGDYVVALLDSLARLARKRGLGLLAHLLTLAVAEAQRLRDEPSKS